MGSVTVTEERPVTHAGSARHWTSAAGRRRDRRRSRGGAHPRPAAAAALAYLGVCLVLIGLNLRTVFSSFSAVLPEVTADAGLPGWAVVVLTTVPVTLLGVFAPLAPVLARRFGAERVLLGAMAVLTAGLLLRPLDAAAGGRAPSRAAGRNGRLRRRDRALQRAAARAW